MREWEYFYKLNKIKQTVFSDREYTFHDQLSPGDFVVQYSGEIYKATSNDRPFGVYLTDNQIVLYGRVNVFNGLNGGRPYFLQSDGSIGLTPTNVYVGTASSDDGLFVDIHVI